jgi:hypothetical protein
MIGDPYIWIDCPDNLIPNSLFSRFQAEIRNDRTGEDTSDLIYPLQSLTIIFETAQAVW